MQMSYIDDFVSTLLHSKLLTCFSGLLTFTYFLRAFFRVNRLDKMLQISTHLRLVSDDGLLLVAHPPHLRSSSTTLSSSSNSLPVIKFKVCGECGTYFGRGRFVTFLKLKLTPKIFFDCDVAVTESCQTDHHLARACVIRGCCQGGPLFSSE
jgi:hypothetical protein